MKRLALILCSLLFALIPCEIILRVVGYRPTMIDARMYRAVDNPLRPYSLAPNYHGYYAGGAVHVDAEGNRIVLPSQCAGRSILIVGDSVAFGQGVDDVDTISSQLQKQTCGSYQIRNIAVPGYSSWNEYDALASANKTDQVILIYVPNDVTRNNNHMQIKAGEIGYLANSRTRKALRFTYSHLYTSFLIANSLRAFSAPGVEEGSLDPQLIKYSMEAVEKMRDLCVARGTGFSVAVYRDVWWYSRAEAKQYEESIRRNLEERKIGNFLLKGHIENLNESQVRVHFNDPHPSKLAIGFIAQDIKEHLASEARTR